jgi:hypothetical protein
VDNGKLNWDLVIAALGATLVLLGVAYGMRFVYGYRVANRAVEIVLFQALPVYRLPVDDIELIQKVHWSELGIWGIGGFILRISNRVARYGVLIKKRGPSLRIVITPDNPDEFIEQVMAARGNIA